MTVMDAVQTIQIIAIFASVVTVILAIYAITLTSRLIREARAYILASQLSPLKIEPRKEAPPAHRPMDAVKEAEQQKAPGLIETSAPAVQQAAPSPPPAPEAQPLIEAPKLTRIEDILIAFGLEELVIFDSLGQVIDYAGKSEPGRVAAMMTELINVVMMADETPSGITIWNNLQTIIAVIGRVDAKTIYLYAKAPVEASKEDINRLIESSRYFIESLTRK